MEKPSENNLIRLDEWRDRKTLAPRLKNSKAEVAGWITPNTAALRKQIKNILLKDGNPTEILNNDYYATLHTDDNRYILRMFTTADDSDKGFDPKFTFVVSAAGELLSAISSAGGEIPHQDFDEWDLKTMIEDLLLGTSEEDEEDGNDIA